MKKLLCCLLALCLLAGLAVTATAEADVVKFGLYYELTGDSAANGERHLRAAQLAIDELNEKGGVLGKKIELVAVDDMSTSAGAIDATELLIDAGVSCIIGPFNSSMSTAVADRIAQCGIPTITGGTSVALLAEGMPENWFRNMAPDNFVTKAIASFLAGDKGFTKIAMIYDSGTFGTGYHDFLKVALAEYNLELVDAYSYTTGDTDHTSQLMAVADSGAEVCVFATPNSADAAVIMRECKELGVEYACLGSAQYGTWTTKGIAGDAAEGFFATQQFNKDYSEVSAHVYDAYKALYGDDADHFVGWVYDAVYIFADAMTRANTLDSAAVVKAMYETKDLVGCLGTYVCQPDGEMNTYVAIVQIVNGEYQLLR